MTSIFITGTDTEIGKTYITCQLLKQLNQQGLSTFGIKPVASGCHLDINGNLRNEDALQLQACASIKKPYAIINPISFEAPIAPHIAAQLTNTPLTAQLLKQTITNSQQPDADVNLIEGFGGWLVPLNDHELLADAVVDMRLPVILVVGIKLGCLNHALLTYQHMLQSKTHLIGWVANCIAPNTLHTNDNIQTLQNWIKAPCLGIMPFNGNESNALNITPLIKCRIT